MATKLQEEITLDEERLIHAMQLLGDKTRYKLFKLLMKQDDLCVTEIATELNISVSAVSQHFRNFEILGLVDKERLGQKICYILRPNNMLVKELIYLINKRRG
jgi:DNA-binding transcriptional ArsR family regulator